MVWVTRKASKTKELPNLQWFSAASQSRKDQQNHYYQKSNRFLWLLLNWITSRWLSHSSTNYAQVKLKTHTLLTHQPPFFRGKLLNFRGVEQNETATSQKLQSISMFHKFPFCFLPASYFLQSIPGIREVFCPEVSYEKISTVWGI